MSALTAFFSNPFTTFSYSSSYSSISTNASTATTTDSTVSSEASSRVSSRESTLSRATGRGHRIHRGGDDSDDGSESDTSRDEGVPRRQNLHHHGVNSQQHYRQPQDYQQYHPQYQSGYQHHYNQSSSSRNHDHYGENLQRRETYSSGSTTSATRLGSSSNMHHYPNLKPVTESRPVTGTVSTQQLQRPTIISHRESSPQTYTPARVSLTRFLYGKFSGGSGTPGKHGAPSTSSSGCTTPRNVRSRAGPSESEGSETERERTPRARGYRHSNNHHHQTHNNQQQQQPQHYQNHYQQPPNTPSLAGVARGVGSAGRDSVMHREWLLREQHRQEQLRIAAMNTARILKEELAREGFRPPLDEFEWIPPVRDIGSGYKNGNGGWNSAMADSGVAGGVRRNGLVGESGAVLLDEALIEDDRISVEGPYAAERAERAEREREMREREERERQEKERQEREMEAKEREREREKDGELKEGRYVEVGTPSSEASSSSQSTLRHQPSTFPRQTSSSLQPHHQPPTTNLPPSRTLMPVPPLEPALPAQPQQLPPPQPGPIPKSRSSSPPLPVPSPPLLNQTTKSPVQKTPTPPPQPAPLQRISPSPTPASGITQPSPSPPPPTKSTTPPMIPLPPSAERDILEDGYVSILPHSPEPVRTPEMPYFGAPVPLPLPLPLAVPIQVIQGLSLAELPPDAMPRGSIESAEEGSSARRNDCGGDMHIAELDGTEVRREGRNAGVSEETVQEEVVSKKEEVIGKKEEAKVGTLKENFQDWQMVERVPLDPTPLVPPSLPVPPITAAPQEESSSPVVESPLSATTLTTHTTIGSSPSSTSSSPAFPSQSQPQLEPSASVDLKTPSDDDHIPPSPSTPTQHLQRTQTFEAVIAVVEPDAPTVIEVQEMEVSQEVGKEESENEHEVVPIVAPLNVVKKDKGKEKETETEVEIKEKEIVVDAFNEKEKEDGVDRDDREKTVLIEYIAEGSVKLDTIKSVQADRDEDDMKVPAQMEVTTPVPAVIAPVLVEGEVNEAFNVPVQAPKGVVMEIPAAPTPEVKEIPEAAVPIAPEIKNEEKKEEPATLTPIVEEISLVSVEAKTEEDLRATSSEAATNETLVLVTEKTEENINVTPLEVKGEEKSTTGGALKVEEEVTKDEMKSDVQTPARTPTFEPAIPVDAAPVNEESNPPSQVPPAPVGEGKKEDEKSTVPVHLEPSMEASTVVTPSTPVPATKETKLETTEEVKTEEVNKDKEKKGEKTEDNDAAPSIIPAASGAAVAAAVAAIGLTTSTPETDSSVPTLSPKEGEKKVEAPAETSAAVVEVATASPELVEAKMEGKIEEKIESPPGNSSAGVGVVPSSSKDAEEKKLESLSETPALVSVATPLVLTEEKNVEEAKENENHSSSSSTSEVPTLPEIPLTKPIELEESSAAPVTPPVTIPEKPEPSTSALAESSPVSPRLQTPVIDKSFGLGWDSMVDEWLRDRDGESSQTPHQETLAVEIQPVEPQHEQTVTYMPIAVPVEPQVDIPIMSPPLIPQEIPIHPIPIKMHLNLPPRVLADEERPPPEEPPAPEKPQLAIPNIMVEAPMTPAAADTSNPLGIDMTGGNVTVATDNEKSTAEQAEVEEREYTVTQLEAEEEQQRTIAVATAAHMEPLAISVPAEPEHVQISSLTSPTISASPNMRNLDDERASEDELWVPKFKEATSTTVPPAPVVTNDTDDSSITPSKAEPDVTAPSTPTIPLKEFGPSDREADVASTKTKTDMRKRFARAMTWKGRSQSSTDGEYSRPGTSASNAVSFKSRGASIDTDRRSIADSVTKKPMLQRSQTAQAAMNVMTLGLMKKKDKDKKKEKEKEEVTEDGDGTRTPGKAMSIRSLRHEPADSASISNKSSNARDKWRMAIGRAKKSETEPPSAPGTPNGDSSAPGSSGGSTSILADGTTPTQAAGPQKKMTFNNAVNLMMLRKKTQDQKIKSAEAAQERAAALAVAAANAERERKEKEEREQEQQQQAATPLAVPELNVVPVAKVSPLEESASTEVPPSAPPAPPAAENTVAPASSSPPSPSASETPAPATSTVEDAPKPKRRPTLGSAVNMVMLRKKMEEAKAKEAAEAAGDALAMDNSVADSIEDLSTPATSPTPVKKKSPMSNAVNLMMMRKKAEKTSDDGHALQKTSTLNGDTASIMESSKKDRRMGMFSRKKTNPTTSSRPPTANTGSETFMRSAASLAQQHDLEGPGTSDSPVLTPSHTNIPTPSTPFNAPTSPFPPAMNGSRPNLVHAETSPTLATHSRPPPSPVSPTSDDNASIYAAEGDGSSKPVKPSRRWSVTQGFGKSKSSATGDNVSEIEHKRPPTSASSMFSAALNFAKDKEKEKEKGKEKEAESSSTVISGAGGTAPTPVNESKQSSRPKLGSVMMRSKTLMAFNKKK